MIELIYGAKGTGKTTRIIDKANACVAKAKGNVVFITPIDKYSLNIDANVRFVVTAEHGIEKECQLESFIKGMIAGNADIGDFFIEGIARIGSVDPVRFIPELDALSSRYNVNFTVTLSMAEVPAELKRYI